MVPENNPDHSVDEALQQAINTGQLQDTDAENPEVAELFAAHQKLDSLFGQIRDISDAGLEITEQEMPSQISHYQIREKLGSGSFGSVYLGHDTKLDRQVAIKIPRYLLPGEQGKEQFLREARAAAQLNHPYIVSVHEVSEENGVPFIVSDYVEGVSLETWSEDQTLTTKDAARLCIKICEAIEHAHQQGVIHRDIKPSNIMIDADGNPHVMDFGLAKHQAEASLSVDGKVLGTPAYMSPEQARGESEKVDPRSDVYSLGVVLFELLTDERPFRGSSQMLIHQVLHDEPPSPRRLNNLVSRDLETITLKCLEKEPGSRYGTAQMLTDDLQLWISGEAITARPVGRAGRLLRWCNRKPMVAGLSAAVAVLLIAGITISWILTTWALGERELANQRASDAEVARDLADQRANEAEIARASESDALAQAQKNFSLAEGMAYKAFEDLNRSRRLMQRGNLPLRMELLKSAREAYQELLEQQPDDIENQVNLAKLHSRLGQINYSLRDFSNGVAESEQAERIFKALTLKHPGKLENQLGLGSEHSNLGRFLNSIGETRRALRKFQQAITVLKPLGEKHPENKEIRSSLADAHHSLGNCLKEIGNFEEAINEYQKARILFEHLTSRYPEEADYGDFLSKTLRSYGSALQETGMVAEAKMAYEMAMQIDKKLIDQYPSKIKYLLNLMATQDWLARLFESIGQFKDAETLQRQLLESNKRLTDEFPQIAEFNFDSARIAMGLGDVLYQLQHIDEAIVSYRTAIEVLRNLIDPESITYSGENRQENPKAYAKFSYYLAASHRKHALALTSQMTADSSTIAQEFQYAIDISSELRQENSEAPEYSQDLALTFQNLGEFYANVGEIDLAADSYANAIEIWELLFTQIPHVNSSRRSLALIYQRAGTLESGMLCHYRYRFDVTIEYCEKALVLLDQLIKENSEDPRLDAQKKYSEILIVIAKGAVLAIEDPSSIFDYPPPQMATFLSIRGFYLADRGDHVASVEAGEKLAELEIPGNKSMTANCVYDAACVLSLASVAAMNDKELSDDERAVLADKYAARAVTLLRQSQDAGFFKAPGKLSELKTLRDLDPLRDRDDFKQLVKEL